MRGKNQFVVENLCAVDFVLITSKSEEAKEKFSTGKNGRL